MGQKAGGRKQRQEAHFAGSTGLLHQRPEAHVSAATPSQLLTGKERFCLSAGGIHAQRAAEC